MLNGLDLFSGIGGISLALQPWIRTVCYVEIDRYCQAVLRTRIRDGDIEDAPIWDDVTTFDPGPWIGAVDIVTGGFPCQDISLAGNGAGLDGERSGLFWEIHRIAGEIRPAFIFLENVPAITGRGGREVVGALTALGYDCRWGVLSAFDVGADHERERWWCLAHVDSPRQSQQEGPQQGQWGWTGNSAEKTLTHADGARLQRGRYAGEDEQDAEDLITWSGLTEHFAPARRERWGSLKPLVGRSVHRIPHRMDRIRGLGNSVVPQCAREAFKRLAGIPEPVKPDSE